MASLSEQAPLHPGSITARFNAWLCGVLGYVVLAAAAASALSLLTWQIADPSLTHAASGPTRNALGPGGAIVSDLIMQLLGLAGVFVILPPVFWALQLIGKGRLDSARAKLMLAPVAVVLLACAASSLPRIEGWPLPYNVGGLLGDLALRVVTSVLAAIRPERASAAAGLFCFAGGVMLLMTSIGLSQRDLKLICQRPRGLNLRFLARAWQRLGEMSERAIVTRREPRLDMPVPRFGPVSRPLQPPVFGPDTPAWPQNRPHRPYVYPDPPPRPVCDDDIDPNELKRIASICAPNKAAIADAGDPPSILVTTEPAEQHHAPRAADPIHAARKVMGAPHDDWHRPGAAGSVGAPAPMHPRADQGASWPVTAPPAPQPPMAPPTDGWRPQSFPGGDDLYGRAVAIVLDDRKASAGYLQQRLAIGYMRAADLIERMEREGILGAPVYNGMRPILIGGPGSREI